MNFSRCSYKMGGLIVFVPYVCTIVNIKKRRDEILWWREKTISTEEPNRMTKLTSATGLQGSILSYFWATEKKQKFSFLVYDDDDYLFQWRSETAFLSKSNERNRETISIIEGRTIAKNAK